MATHRTPDAEWDLAETVNTVRRAIEGLAHDHPKCGVIFRRILESFDNDGGPREIFNQALRRIQKEYPEMSSGNFHVTLHRCRARLREVFQQLNEAEAL